MVQLRTCRAASDLMYDTRPSSPHRSRIILGDGSIKKVQVVGKLDLVFHRRTDHPVTLHDVSFGPDLGFNLFSFHVVHEKHEIILNKTGAHLLGGRLVFPRRCNGLPLHATRVLPEQYADASTALATFIEPPLHPVIHQKSGEMLAGQATQVPELAKNVLVQHGERVKSLSRS